MSIEKMEYRHVNIGKLETRLSDGEDGTFRGYANLHGVRDSYDTAFAPGSWTSGGLDGARALLFMHNPDEPVGVFSAREDDTGLLIEGRYDPTPEGQRARQRAASGSAPELSVGFIRRSVDAEDETLITSAELKEVSQITLGFAAQPGAELTAVRKAAEMMQRMDEQIETQDTEDAEDQEVEQAPEEATAEPEVTEDDAEELQEQVPDGVEVEVEDGNERMRTARAKAAALRLKAAM